MNIPPKEIFKAYDIRGVVGKSLTAEGVRAIGQALGSELLERGGHAEIAVGRDGRLSGPELAGALMEGIRASGVDVAEIGMFATPVAYFAAHELGCGSAVAVTGRVVSVNSASSPSNVPGPTVNSLPVRTGPRLSNPSCTT